MIDNLQFRYPWLKFLTFASLVLLAASLVLIVAVAAFNPQ